jgi:hypothetical protein
MRTREEEDDGMKWRRVDKRCAGYVYIYSGRIVSDIYTRYGI